MPVLSVDQTGLLIALALVPLVLLGTDRGAARFAARSAILGVLLSAAASMILVPTMGSDWTIANGPLSPWVWISTVPVIGAGALLALGATYASRPDRERIFWKGSVQLESLWAGVAGLCVMATLLFPKEWVHLTTAALAAGAVLTLGIAWLSALRPRIGRLLRRAADATGSGSR